MSAPVVAIIGRPNVGKSTLFNRLVEERQAIVDDASGVTRDRNYGESHWNGREFLVIDTGGYVPESNDTFEKAIREQVHLAMEEADVMIFVVDATTGLTPLDREFAHIVRKSPKKVFIAANKVDSNKHRDLIYDFYEMGLDEVFGISAMNGSGTGDLLDAVVEALPKEGEVEDLAGIPKITIVGRPNVGKSSLVNALLGRDVNIVTPIAGTTRDSVDTRYTAFGHDIILVDTAGLRKKSKIKENIEFYSTLRSVRSIENCDVAILMIDATMGIEAQDLSIAGLAIKNGSGLVIAVNKWDLAEKETNTARDLEKGIKKRLEPFSDVPVIFISVTEKQRLLKVMETAIEVYKKKSQKISTSELNEVMQVAIAQHHPPANRGKMIRIKYVTQVVPSKIPTFLFFANHPKDIIESYKRYLENKLREHYDFTGVPINVFFRQK